MEVRVRHVRLSEKVGGSRHHLQLELSSLVILARGPLRGAGLPTPGAQQLLFHL